MFVSCPFPFFAEYMCPLLTLMKWMLTATLTVAWVPVAPDRVLWNIFRHLGHINSSIISVKGGYVLQAIFHIDVADDMVGNIHVRVACCVNVG